MYKHPVFLVFLLIILTAKISLAQSVGIGTTSPDQSAALDVSHTNKGVLLPQLTSSQRQSIPNPAISLLVFDTYTESFWWRGETDWVELISSNIGLRDTDSDTRVEVEQSEDEDEIAFTVEGTERGRFFNDQFYINNKLTLGTYAKRGMFTLRGPNDVEFGPTIFMYGNNSDQAQSGRIRFVEGIATGNWRGAYMHYNGASNLFHLGTHNSSDSNPSSDINALTIKRINGFVGINNENPQKRFSVTGDIEVDNGSQVIIETEQNNITLIAGSTQVLIDANGGIVISSPSGNIDMNANNISISASNDIQITAGKSFTNNVGTDYSLTTVGNLSTVVGSTYSASINQGLVINAGTAMSIQSGSNLDVTIGGSTNIISAGTTDIKGAQVLLNASSSSTGAARVGDKTVTPTNSTSGTITTGSSSVKIGD